MIDCSTEDRCVEASVHQQRRVRDVQVHFHSHRREIGEVTVDAFLQHFCHPVFLECNRPVGGEPLIEPEGTCGPFPASSGFRFEDDFFGDRGQLLLLFQHIDIGRREVLIDKHTVTQVLQSRYRTQCEVVSLIFQIQPCIHQIAIVTAGIIVGRFQVGSRVLVISSVSISSLIAVLIADVQVQLHVLAGQVDASEPSSGSLAFVYLFVKVGILEKASSVFIKCSGGEGKLIRHAVIVSHGSIVIIVSPGTQSKVGALITERRFGVYLDQSSHGVASIEGSLRTAQHVDALNVGIVEVES